MKALKKLPHSKTYYLEQQCGFMIGLPTDATVTNLFKHGHENLVANN